MNAKNPVYYTTFCTKDFEPSLWRDGAAADIDPRNGIPLSERGLIVERAINAVSESFERVTTDKYVIMPNHVHILFTLSRDEGQPDSAMAKLVSAAVTSIKRAAAKEDKTIAWQKSSNDRPVKNDEGYRIVSEYIETNPFKWSDDCYKLR